MNKEKEIEKMIEVLANKHFEKNPHEYIANMPRAICSTLLEAGYRKADEVRKETAREVLDEIAKHYCGAWLVELYKKYGVEVDE